jgi:hypothetical protein
MNDIVKVDDAEINKAAEKLNPRINELMKLAEMEVETDEDATLATDTIKRIKQLLGSLEDDRTSLTKPINSVLANINARYKGMKEPLEKIEKALRAKLQGHLEYKQALQREEDDKRRKEEAAREAALQAERASVYEEAKVPGFSQGGAVEIKPLLVGEGAQILPAIKPVAPPRARGETASAGLRTMMDWRLVDKAALFAKFPDLLVVDKKAVDAMIKSGIRTIEGIDIFETSTLAVR